jgi:C-methyltransferase
MATTINTAEPQGPMAVLQLLHASEATAALCSAIELGLFPALEAGPLSAAAAAQRIGCPARSTRILLNALAAIGLVAKEGTSYRLTSASEAHLIPGKPAYLGDFAGIVGHPVMWAGLAHLTEAVRNDGTVLPAHAETREHPFWEAFAKSSASMAIPASAILEGLLHAWIAAKPKVRVLDIAAGSGIYGYTLVQKNNNVELVSLDWPNVLAETKHWGERLGVDAHRVSYLAGNLFEVEYGGPYDLVVLSHVYHHFDSPTCVALTRKVARALAPGGRVAVQEFLASDTNPAAAMFAARMLLWSRQGDAYSAEEVGAWFAEAGLERPTVHPNPGMPTSFLLTQRTGS